MRIRAKVGLGCLTLLIIGLGFGAYSWFMRPPRPIVVADPGAGGARVTIGDAPANFYPGQGEGRRPAILLLGGSEGGLKEFRNVLARQLTGQGYSVLYAGYAETREDNRAFDMVPLETFQKALAWLRARPDIDRARIAIIGHSKGAEAALLVASRNPGIAAVVAAMPSDVVWQGFDFSSLGLGEMRSAWSEAGKPLPYVPYILPAWYEWMTGGSETLAKMHTASWEARGKHPGSAIPVGKIAAPVLLICGGQDMVWPSCPMARAAKARAPGARLLEYPVAGHWAFGPATGLTEGDRRSLGKLGGTAATDLAARRDQWPKLIDFLGQHLGEGR